MGESSVSTPGVNRLDSLAYWPPLGLLRSYGAATLNTSDGYTCHTRNVPSYRDGQLEMACFATSTREPGRRLRTSAVSWKLTKLTHILGVGRAIGGWALAMALRACRAPDHESEAKASCTVVARCGARIPKVFPTALFTLDEGRRLPRLPSSVATPV